MPKIAVGDTTYGTVPNIVGLEERGIRAYLFVNYPENNLLPRGDFGEQRGPDRVLVDLVENLVLLEIVACNAGH